MYTGKRLKKSLVICQALFDTSLDAIITINGKGRIELVNHAAEEMFGYDKKEMIGKNVKVLIPLSNSVIFDKYLLHYLEMDDKENMTRIETRGLKKDGVYFPLDLAITSVTWAGDRYFAGVIRDLTARHELEQRLNEIGNNERRRIGRDLHDGLGQMLTGIRMLTENLAGKLHDNASPAAEEVQEIAEMIKEADQFARILSRDMVQVDIRKKGLGIAIQKLCKLTTKMTGVECSIVENNKTKVENDTKALHIYRIVQEAICNAVKHSKAGNVTVRLSGDGLNTSVSVEDNGNGFDPDKINNEGMGLQIMEYRAAIIGGVLEIIRTDEGLTEVRCIIPNKRSLF